MINNKLLFRTELFDLAEEAADLLLELEKDKILTPKQNDIVAKKLDHLFKSKIQCTKLRNDFIDDFYIKDVSPSLENNQDLDSIFKTASMIQGLLLEEKEMILKTLLDHVPIEIVIKDENNTVLHINNLAAKKRGGDVNDFEGKNLYDLLPFEIANKYHKDDLDVFKANKKKEMIREVGYLNSSGCRLLHVKRVSILTRENKKIMLLFCSPEMDNIFKSLACLNKLI